MKIRNLHSGKVLRDILVVLLINILGIAKAVAYDFSAVCSTGQTLYYSILNPNYNYVQVVHAGVGYIRPTGDLIIPSVVSYSNINYTVTKIGDFAFQNSSELTAVTIPNTVTTIGQYAFDGCNSMTTINIPNSVTSIDERALSGCSGLTSFDIPSSVTSIGDFAFIGCNGLTSLTIPSSVTIIGESPCCHCTQIETIIVESGNPVYDSRNNCNAIIKTSNNVLITGCKSTIIPNTVTTIGTAAFEGCTGLSGLLYIPNSVVTIGGSAFRDCSGLMGSLVIPNSVVSIGNAAFYGCNGLNGTLSLPNSVTSIGEWAFSSCHLTGNLTIPNSVTLIGNFAFYGCTFSGNLVIPNSLTSIGNSTFLCCRNLTSLYIPNSVVSIGREAFGSCEGLTGSLSIPNSVLSIGDGAFSSCSGLTGSLSIPNSVISIGDNPFRGTGIESISVASDNPIYDSRNNCNAIINTNSNELITGCSSTIIPNTVTSIADNAFTGATGLLVIPNSVTTIGDGAFQGCNKITTVVLGNSVTSIGANAFGWCRDINSMMVLSDTPPMLGAGTFSFVPTNIPVAVPCGTVGVYQATTGWESFSDLMEMCSPATITCAANPPEGGIVTGSGTYEASSLCTLQATANDDYLFVNWSRNGEVVSVFPSYSFAVTEDAYYEAVFIPRNGVIVGTSEVSDDGWLPSYSLYNYSLSQQIYTKNELGNAQNITSISFYNAGFENTRNYDIYLVHTEKTRFNNKMDWIAVNETNKVFSGNVTLEKGYWTTIELDTPFAYNGTSNLALIVDDNTGSWDYDLVRCRTFNTNEQQAIMVYSDQTNYNVNYSYYNASLYSSKNQIIFNINNNSVKHINAVSNPIGGGFISGAGNYAIDAICTLTATANSGYVFVDWTENDTVVSTNASYTFVVNANHNFVANFDLVLPESYVITATANPPEGGRVILGTSESLLFEPFEEYTLGNKIAAESIAAGHDWWTTWSNIPGSAEDAVVANYNGTQCGHLIYGNDQVLLLGDEENGIYDLEFDILVPQGKNGYFNILHHFAGSNSTWAMQCYLHLTNDGQNSTQAPGHGTIHAGSNNTADIPCVYDAWMHFRLNVDTDTDVARYYYTAPGENEILICEWQWSLDSFGENVVGRTLSAMNFFPPENSATSEFYLDNFRFNKISEDTAPELTINPMSIQRTLGEDDIINVPITISNYGNSIGDWSGWLDFGQGGSGSQSADLYYHSGEESQGIGSDAANTREMGIRLPATAYAGASMGMRIVSAKYYISDMYQSADHNYIFRIYGQGLHNQPGELLAEKTVYSTAVGSWITATFDYPVYMTGQTIWATVQLEQAAGEYPLSMDGGDYGEESDGNWLSTNSNSFSHCYSSGSFGGAWLISVNCLGELVPATWASINKTEGSIFGGQSETVTLSLNSIGLDSGTSYTANLILNTNDESIPYVEIPVTLNVSNNKSANDVDSFEPLPIVSDNTMGKQGSVRISGVYEAGSICNMTAIPYEGYTFTNWTKNGVQVSTNAAYSFIVTENASYVANFRASNVNHWDVDIHQYPYNMSVTGIIQIDGVEQQTETLEIGAFCGSECRGTQRLTYFPQVDRYLVFLTLYGDAGDVMNFRLYDHALGQELDMSCSSTITFVPDGFMGTPFEPYVFDFNMTVDQISSFSQGYNWWCTYIEQSDIDGLGMLQEGLGNNGVSIRSQANGYTDYYQGYGWYGSLSSINNESSYRVITSAPCTVTMTGNMAVPSEHPISLGQGWTWIGYVPTTAMDVNVAMSGLTSTSGDKLKSQQGYADYYPGYGWFGSLNTIEPGMGLMYYSMNGNPVTFTYPDNGRGGEQKQNLTAEHNHWKPNTFAYPDNMTVMATIELNGEELNSDHYELAAFAANGECRGSVKLTYAEPINRHVAFLTISGKDAAELSFRLYDTETGVEYYDAEESLSFVANAIVGDASDLYVVHFRGTTGMDELAGKVQVYPNPVNCGERFIVNVADDVKNPVHVEIINALGVETLRATSVQTPAQLTAPATAGVYTLRITVEGKEAIIRKLVVNP